MVFEVSCLTYATVEKSRREMLRVGTTQNLESSILCGSISEVESSVTTNRNIPKWCKRVIEVFKAAPIGEELKISKFYVF